MIYYTVFDLPLTKSQDRKELPISVKRLRVLGIMLGVMLCIILAGCGGKPGSGTTSYGSIRVSITVPPGPSVYPVLPEAAGQRAMREIPAGTTQVLISIQNANYHYRKDLMLNLEPGQSTAEESCLVPVATGYYINVAAANDQNVALVGAKQTDISVSEGTTTSVSMVLTRLSFNITSFASTVAPGTDGDRFRISGTMTTPIDMECIHARAYLVQQDDVNYRWGSGYDCSISFAANVSTEISWSLRLPLLDQDTTFDFSYIVLETTWYDWSFVYEVPAGYSVTVQAPPTSGLDISLS